MTNSFNNDGSFMESFMKMEQEKKAESTPCPQPKPKPKPKLLPPVRKPVVMRVSKVKKAPVLVKPASTRAALEGRPFLGQIATESRKEPGIPMASSIGLASSGGVSPEPSVVTRETSVSASEQAPGSSATTPLDGRKRRRNRWSDAPPSGSAGATSTAVGVASTSAAVGVASTSAADAAISAAMASFSECDVMQGLQQPLTGTGGQNLTPEQLQQIKEQIEMNKLVAEIRCSMERTVKKKKAKDPKQPILEYDSDEETDGGTWEHKKRAEEMISTLEKAVELTELSKGKHHIGDFLPPKELETFMEKATAIREGRNPDFSDYKEHKLGEANVGFKLLQKAGWEEGQGLGEKADGITAPINQGKTSFNQAGVGVEMPGEVGKDDDSFDTYRKRMMLAYRFRPNPLNNPRRPYY